MTDLATVTRDHYQAAVTDEAALLRRVGAIVDDMGAGPRTTSDLAGLDQFHVGGLMATAEFARRIGVEPGSRVLDAGSGLGGPARYLAETFGCEVLGIDLTPSYVAMANLLTERAGLGHLVRCEVGDLTELSLGSAPFDLVSTQHVAMNIRDRGALYTSLHRVLKKGGRLAFYDVLASDTGAEPVYPMPWAETAGASTLLTEAATRQVLADCGFTVSQWDDVSQQAVGWLGQQIGSGGALPGGGAGLVVGPRIAQMAGNFVRNLSEGRLRLVMAVCAAS